MLGASCSLETSETVLTKHMNYEGTHEGPVYASSRDACSSGVSTVSESGEMTKFSPQPFGPKGVILTPWFKWEVVQC